jgi:hypothetical protein
MLKDAGERYLTGMARLHPEPIHMQPGRPFHRYASTIVRQG